jgi:phage tail-like protein
MGSPVQAAQGIVSGGLTQHMFGAKRTAAAGGTTMLGLASRFEVTIGGLSIGLWRSCSGLGVDFQPGQQHVSGDPAGQYWLPGQLKYPSLVLERAVEPESSRTLQKWLVDMVRSGADGTGDAKRTTARIRLLDAAGAETASWLFYGVRPSAWAGPDLNSGSTEVAVEKLTLVHEGFLDQLQTTAKVANLGLGTDKIQFSYNPASIRVAQANGSALAEPGLRLTMDDVLLAGPGVAHDVQKMISWGRMQKKGKNAAKLPVLNFSWGPTSATVTLQHFSFSLTHFGTGGLPIRATATLTLQTTTDKLYATATSASRTPWRNLSNWRADAVKAGRDDPMRHSAGQGR